MNVSDLTKIQNIKKSKPCFGDHELIQFNIDEKKPNAEIEIKRDCQNYLKQKLCDALNSDDWAN